MHAKLQYFGGITGTKAREKGPVTSVRKIMTSKFEIDKVESSVQDKFRLVYIEPHLSSHLRHGFHPEDQQFGTAPEASLLCALCYSPQGCSSFDFRINSPCCKGVRTHLPQWTSPCGQRRESRPGRRSSSRCMSKDISQIREDHFYKTEQKQCLSNLTDVLNATNSSWDKVVKVNIYLKDMGDFDRVNETYTQVCLLGPCVQKNSP